MSQKNIPLKVKISEEIIPMVYAILTYIAVGLLILSTSHISIVYVGALLFRTQYDTQLAQLGIYIVVGTFLFIFVYDKKCKRRCNIIKNNEN